MYSPALPGISHLKSGIINKCYLTLLLSFGLIYKWVEFNQKENGTINSMAMRLPTSHSTTRNQTLVLQFN